MSDRDELLAVLKRCEAGELSPAVALMQMLIAGESDALVAEVVGTVNEAGGADGSPRLAEVARLLEANGAGCARVAAMLKSGVDVPPKDGSVEDGIAFCRRLFDWSVTQSEEASVALYSLGNPKILAEATREIDEALNAWGCLGRDRRALDLGCGIGRLETALASKLSHIDAVDVSPQMIEVAKRRCQEAPGELSNVTFTVVSGSDLAIFGDQVFDLVLAIDSMPYVVQSGPALAQRYFAEVARVLRPGGDFVILNYSYRGDHARDRDDVSALAVAHGLHVRVDGTTPFDLWDAVAFVIAKEG